MKLTEARQRTLRYMADTGCEVIRFGNSTGWTCDVYQWPISTLSFEALLAERLIAVSPSSGNEHLRYRITDAGRRALSSQSQEPSSGS